MTKRILIADDEPTVRQLLEVVLRSQGYEVFPAQNGDQLVRTAQEIVPDLVLVDLMMPHMDGYEAIRQLRNDTRTAHLPMLILTAKSTPDDVVTGFETGADDYIIKPFNIPELLARIKSHLARAARKPVLNPLTGLSGNILLTEELKYRLKSGALFALLYVDIDNFKAFNDTYGPARGDRVIRLVAEVVQEAVQTCGTSTDFIGHIGGDDFAILTNPDVIPELCQCIIKLFDERVRTLYDPEDLARGYLIGTDRQGVPRRFPIISVSIGVVTNRHRTFADHEEASRVAAEMKQFAKQQPGSFYAVDVRGTQPAAVAHERRGSAPPAVLVVTADDGLRRLLQTALKDNGYRTLEAPGVIEAGVLLAYELDLSLIVADARLGDSLWEMADQLREEQPLVPLLVITTRQQDEDAGAAHGVQHFLRQPFRTDEFLALVAQTILQNTP
ncbi:MAG: response regulator [Chloroflexota bacterium]|nr:MAG: diguanylate cyclase [Chloroflexota bacterium]